MNRCSGSVLLLLALALAGCSPLLLPTPTATPPPTTLILPIAELFERVDALETRVTLLEATPVVTPTPTATSTPTARPSVTPTVSATPTPTPTKPGPTPTVPIVASTNRPGGYGQFDWACPWPLEPALGPDGVTMMLCPSGIDYTGPPKYKNINAFRTDGGMDWVKARTALKVDYLALGGLHWVSWADLNPAEGVYDWGLIDRYVAAAQGMQMESGGSLSAPKGVIVRIYDALSNVPGETVLGAAFDDYTPAWVRNQIGGSYVVSMPACSPSTWIVPKYDRQEWRNAAGKMLRDVSARYAGSGVSFSIGINGLDGEYGQFLPERFGGCAGLRQALLDQYGLGAGQMVWRTMPSFWTGTATVTCSGFCDPNAILSQPGLGLYLARAVDDGPDYHRADGGMGVMDWALAFSQAGRVVQWENASGDAGTAYLYRMLSLVSMTWPQSFSFVGGSWDGSKDLLRSFTYVMGETPATAQTVYWRAYVSCYLPGGGCPGDWARFQGWPTDIARGVTTTANWAPVQSWTELTDLQRSASWSSMLRKAMGTSTFTIDKAWPGPPKQLVVKYLDKGVGTASIAYTTKGGAVMTWWIPRNNTGAYAAQAFSALDVDMSTGLTLVVSGEVLYLHGVEVSK